MKLWFLGTGAGRPARHRNVSAAALELPCPSNEWWLFDAGEATQHQLMELPLKLSRLEAVFITHLHGDHIYGLPGLLSTRSFEGGTTPLRIFGPAGIKQYLSSVFSISGTELDYELDIHELETFQDLAVLFKDARFTVEAGWLKHRIPCLGYRITEHDQPGRLMADKLRELGIEEGPLFGQIKKGLPVRAADGSLVKAENVTGPVKRGRIVVILGDTSPCPNVQLLAKDADLLVHEATFEAGLEDKAFDYGHSTSKDAALAARSANVRKLVLTHFSSRYSNDELQQLVREAEEEHPNVTAALDLTAIEVGRPE